jgi:LacI family transcriptional regulator
VEKTVRAAFLRSDPMDAILAVRNVIAIYAFQVLQLLDLKIPRDVALVGFDDFELACTLRPAVTVVRQPVEAMASRAARLLFDQIHSGEAVLASGEVRPEILQTSLIVRASCGCHP